MPNAQTLKEKSINLISKMECFNSSYITDIMKTKMWKKIFANLTSVMELIYSGYANKTYN